MNDRRVDPVDTSGVMEPRFHAPGDFHVGTSGVISVQATQTVTAPTNNSKFVVTGFSFGLASVGYLTAATIGMAVIDGISGGSTYLYKTIASVGSIGAIFIERNSLNLVGSNNTALTIEFDAAVTGAYESVNLEYHTLGATGV